MATAIRVPDLGTNVEEVRLLAWKVAVGDAVKRGDILAEVETDKAATDLESIAEGVVLKLVAAEDEEVPAGGLLAWIGQAGEVVPDDSPQPQAAATPPEASSTTATPAPLADSDRSRVPPMLANLAKKLGVDLADLNGTGPEGRITREDILKAAGGGDA